MDDNNFNNNYDQYQNYNNQPIQKRNDGSAIGALVCGIVGLFCCGPILGIVAIVLSQTAKQNIERDPNLEGSGMAQAGLILGIIDIVLGIFGFVALRGYL